MSVVTSEPVRSPDDGSVRGWVRQHTDRPSYTDYGIVVDVSCFLSPDEARELARTLAGVADEYEGRCMAARRPGRSHLVVNDINWPPDQDGKEQR